MMPESEGSATRRSYDSVARCYVDEIGDELGGKPLDRALLPTMAELAGSGLVADIGSGPGHVAAFLGRRSVRTIGLDLSHSMCAIGRRGTSLPFCAADMTKLPLASGSLTGIVCLYAVIHLEAVCRGRAYREFARTLSPNGYILISFHVSDAEVPAGGARTFTEWWGVEVLLTFRLLDPTDEISMLENAGLKVTARVDREPYPGNEHPSKRCYLLAQRQAD
jgi:SAM-dependent methyltransferase